MADQDRNRPGDDSNPDRDFDKDFDKDFERNFDRDFEREFGSQFESPYDGPPQDQPGRHDQLGRPNQSGQDHVGPVDQPGQPAPWDVPPADRPRPAKKSWKERLFSPKAARFVSGSGVPMSMVGSEERQGLLAQAAEEFGWQVSDSDPQADALFATMPARGVAGYRPGHVINGRFDPFAARASQGLPTGEWAFVAFDAVEDSRLGRAVRACFTAVPTMVELPAIRVLPSRFLTGPARGMAVFPTVDPIFDARFKLLAANGERELQVLTALISDEVRDKMCQGADLDEIWTAGDHIVVTTGGPHTEESLARHLEILGALLRALRGEAARDL